jgi:hypothetical protein
MAAADDAPDRQNFLQMRFPHSRDFHIEKLLLVGLTPNRPRVTNALSRRYRRTDLERSDKRKLDELHKKQADEGLWQSTEVSGNRSGDLAGSSRVGVA